MVWASSGLSENRNLLPPVYHEIISGYSVQIPLLAVNAGEFNTYGTGDPSDGGITNRHSLSGNVWSRGDSYKNELNAYAVYSDLDLFSNFTGYLDYPNLGDQINQKERRWVGGANGEQTWFNNWFGFEMDNSVGFLVRHDSINGLALNRSVNRQVFKPVSNADLHQCAVLCKPRPQFGAQGHHRRRGG